eukprot:942490-Rhodomonas_salina.1
MFGDSRILRTKEEEEPSSSLTFSPSSSSAGRCSRSTSLHPSASLFSKILPPLELALGQVYQTGDVNCFGKMHRRMRGVGIASIWTSFSIASYYCVILGYCCIMLINVGREPWLGNEAGKGTLGEWST